MPACRDWRRQRVFGQAMIIGVPKEIKDHEFRVGLTPDGTRALVKAGHRVLVEAGAGAGSGLDDPAYRAAGAEVVSNKTVLFERADLIVKVKEPLPSEYPLFRKSQALFTYLHLAANRPLTEALLDRRVFAIAYETVERSDGGLPILRPMSEVAGRLSVQIGAHYLERTHGGRGVLLGGVVRRSEEHTSELQSRLHLVCRLLLEKKKHTQASHEASQRGARTTSTH